MIDKCVHTDYGSRLTLKRKAIWSSHKHWFHLHEVLGPSNSELGADRCGAAGEGSYGGAGEQSQVQGGKSHGRMAGMVAQCEWMHLMPLNCAIKIATEINFRLHIFVSWFLKKLFIRSKDPTLGTLTVKLWTPEAQYCGSLSVSADHLQKETPNAGVRHEII